MSVIQFEQMLASIKAITAAGPEEIKELRKSILDVSTCHPIGFVELAAGCLSSANKGVGIDDILGTLQEITVGAILKFNQ